MVEIKPIVELNVGKEKLEKRTGFPQATDLAVKAEVSDEVGLKVEPVVVEAQLPVSSEQVVNTTEGEVVVGEIDSVAVHPADLEDGRVSDLMAKLI